MYDSGVNSQYTASSYLQYEASMLCQLINRGSCSILGVLVVELPDSIQKVPFMFAPPVGK